MSSRPQPLGMPRLLAFLAVVTLAFGADKGQPLWLLRPLFAGQARAGRVDVGLRFARTYNKTATAKHGAYRVAAIGCHPWTAGLLACDVLFVVKKTGVFSCAVVGLDPAAVVVAARPVACPAGLAGKPKA